MLPLAMPWLQTTRMMTTNDTHTPNAAAPIQMKPLQQLDHLFSLRGKFSLKIVTVVLALFRVQTSTLQWS